MWVWIIVILGIVAVDQASKHLVMNFLDREQPFVLIDGVLEFSYVENDGAAMGMFGDHRWVFMIVSTVGILALLVYLWRFRPDSLWACTAIAMIIGGGIGNMIDRCFYMGTLPDTVGKHVVIDFINFCAFPEIWPWVFNIADSFVCVGAGILMVWCVWSLIVEVKAEKAKKHTGESDTVAAGDGNGENAPEKNEAQDESGEYKGSQE